MTVEDGITYDGVIHVVSNVLIPPKSVGGMLQEWNGEELDVEDLKARLDVSEQDETAGEDFDAQEEDAEDNMGQAYWKEFL